MILAIAIKSTLGLAAQACAQDDNPLKLTPDIPPDDRYHPEYWQKFDTEVLKTDLEYYTRYLEKVEKAPPYPEGRHNEALAQSTRSIVYRLQQMLFERGIKFPGRALPPSDAAPAPTPPASGAPKSGIGPVPLVLYMTAAEVARCGTDGISVPDCAVRLAARAAVGLAAGAVITVISPVGAPILTGFAILSATGELVVAAQEASTNYAEQERQRLNAERMTPDKMNAIVSAYLSRFQQAHIDRTLTDDLTTRTNELQKIVDAARRDFNAFRDQNTITKRASAACENPKRQPLALAASADDIERQSAAIVKLFGDAAARASTCTTIDNARRAGELFSRADRDAQFFSQVGEQARSDLRDAVQFFMYVKAARQSLTEAARRIAQLEQALPAATNARSAIGEAADAYRSQLAAHQTAITAVYVGLNNLRAIFPSAPAQHIAEGLRRIDDAYTREASNVIPRQALLGRVLSATDDLSRIEGWIRTAKDEYDDLRACGQVTGDIPPELQRDLERIGTSISRAASAVEQARTANKDIPAKAQECLNRLLVPAEVAGAGQLSGACSGTVDVNPLQGTSGSPFSVRVTVAPPVADSVTRVTVDNPGCNTAACREMRLLRLGDYSMLLRFQAPASTANRTFNLKVTVFSGERAICRGQSPTLTVQ